MPATKSRCSPQPSKPRSIRRRTRPASVRPDGARPGGRGPPPGIAYIADTAKDLADPGQDATIHVDAGADSEIEAPLADLPDFLTEDALAVVNRTPAL